MRATCPVHLSLTDFPVVAALRMTVHGLSYRSAAVAGVWVEWGNGISVGKTVGTRSFGRQRKNRRKTEDEFRATIGDRVP